MNKIKKIFTNKRILILLAFLIISVILIQPGFSEQGVAIRSVQKDSAAAQAFPTPILSPPQTTKPMGREVILSVNDQPINTIKEYYDSIEQFQINDTFTIKTNKKTYFITINPLINLTLTNETETTLINRTTVNETTNETITEEIETEKPVYKEEIIGKQDIGITVYDRPTSNVKKGLDLEGGTRVLLKPQEEINDEDMDIIVENIKQRLNVFGVSDITVRPTRDFFGNQFISVEIAGTNEDQIKELLTQQGEFQAKIGQITVFEGGNKDILNVCRTSQCSFIDPINTCQQTTDGTYFCGFWFQITLSQIAAERQADATRDLGIIPSSSGQNYLTENLSLILDGEKVDELSISSGLKGLATTQIRISGSGQGTSQKSASENAKEEMKRLQTLLITGSLPVKLEIANVNTVSAILGKDFTKTAMNTGLLAILAVIIVVAIRYREPRISIPMAITMLSEVIILLGFAAFIGWNIDIVAIAAIIIAVGSGVDDQIVITDETLGRRKNKDETIDWKARMKRAFFIIMAAYFTLVVAMIPLMFAGAGLLMGFAITTIAGVTIGVLITRPAFAAILEILLEK
ncbi:hypothetical protein K9L97_02375 [Candidatus Woesearchaeota archaeon]|nr:hypothetical protein [Candidatus Woesearchaeota archaeon]